MMVEAEAVSTASQTIQLRSCWLSRLKGIFETQEMQKLKAFLQHEKQEGQTIFPPGALMFNALNTTPFEKVKVVVIGQDPYHGPGQAHGLSFSVPDGVPHPPSLRNIYKEIHRDLGIPVSESGNLIRWADQGVLLLNSVLSVRAGHANSHQGRGWEYFTDAIINALNHEREGLVFLLWGSYAQKKGQMIDRNKHFVLTAPHPSPLSAHRGFFGCSHFSKANQYLTSLGCAPINW